MFVRCVWDFLRRLFEDCTSCCDVLDPDYYRKASPGVLRSPHQVYSRCESDVKYLTQSQVPLTLSPSSSSYVGLTKHSTASGSETRSRSLSETRSNYTYSYYKEEETDRQVQFLFYGGSDHSTFSSAGRGLNPSGYRSDMISHYVQPVDPMSSTLTKPPRINHEMPCFFSPRDASPSPMSAFIYSPHLFTVQEQQRRRTYGYSNLRASG